LQDIKIMSHFEKMCVNTIYEFDPTYGYSLEQLLAVAPPAREPADFDLFWQQRYQHALTLAPQVQLTDCHETVLDWQVFKIHYLSCDNFPIHGWLLLPSSGHITRGFVIGHGYGGRDAPDFHLPFKDAALLFPCFRGLSLSSRADISNQPFWHVRHNLNQVDNYILGGCVEDVWLGVSALLQLYPNLAGHLGYLGISFAGGIGAMALAYETRISRGHLNIPSFGHQPLRLRLKSCGSADSVQQFYSCHKKQTVKVLRYYDAATAAKRIKIPMHCACAKFDPFVAPPTQFAIFNALASKKQLYVLDAGHYAYPEQQQQEQALLTELNGFFAPLVN
jgi:cephalosporin-C deacetylase